jgi:translocation and assembly module TamB
MKFTRKTVWKIAAIGGALFCVVAVAFLVILQSNWFRNEVRKRIVAQVETATGGKVEIAGFDYDWRKLTADLQGFVIHGTEAAPAPPLLRVETARITVRVISVLKRSADVSSIVLTRPEVNLIVAPDGSTNLPTPRVARTGKDPIRELFALKLSHFAVNNGLAVVNLQRVPLNTRADGVEIIARYRRAGPSYDVTLSSRQIDLGFGSIMRGPLQLDAQASLGQDRVFVQKLSLNGADSSVYAHATLDHFAHPRLDFQLDAVVATNAILPPFKVAYVRDGKLAVRGAGHYDENNGWSFTGKADAQQAGFASRTVTLKSINATADVEARKSGLALRHITATARGAKFNGEAMLKNYRNLSFDGNLSGLSLLEAASFFTNKPLPWQGVASGRVHGAGTLDARTDDFAVEANLLIAASPTGIPVSGAVDLSYLQKSNSLDFGPSQLNFPHSTVSFSGSLRGDNQVTVDSSDLEDLKPVVSLLSLTMPADAWPVLLRNGKAHFDGLASDLLSSPKFDGQLTASGVRVEGQAIDQITAKFNASGNGIDFAALDAKQGDTRINGTGLIGFSDWAANADSPLRAAVALHGVNVGKVAAQFAKIELPIIQGIASGTVQLRGTIGHPEGRAHIASDSLDAYGERLNQVQFDAELTGEQLQISHGRVVSGGAVLDFSGEYSHRPATWTSGQARIKVDSNGFPLASLSPIRKYQPALNAQAEMHFETSARVSPEKFELTGACGTIELSNVTWNEVLFGNLTVRSETHGQTLAAVISGDFRKNPLHGTASVDLAPGNRSSAEVDFDRVTFASLYSLRNAQKEPLFDGFMDAKLRLDGSLQDPAQMRISFRSDQLQLSSQLNPDALIESKGPAVSLHNAGPLLVDFSQGVATVRSLRIEGDQTSLAITGTIPAEDRKPVDLQVTGSVNLQAYHLFDPNVESSGISNISATIGGTLRDPIVNGTLEIKDGTFVPENIPNGLSAVNGTLTFTRNRATLQKMTAKSGGGDLALGGFLSFGGGGPLVYHLEGSAENVRVRYAGSISVTASSKLRLSGTSNNSVVSGTITISRIVFNANTDVGNILSGLSAANAAPGNDNDFITGLHLDVVIESAPNLQLSTALSRDVEAEINLRLRGTPEHPVLLGNLAANQGDIQAFGTRYSINRGEISFSNPVKVEPALDLDLETQSRGVTIDITISGTFSKLNIAYRSDPPLQPREIIALLAVGRAPASIDSPQTLRTNETNTLQSGTNSLLGAAMTSPVTNRLSKLFGITNIRVDPLVQGITNTPQTRVTLEQQISSNIVITYITNLQQTSEQIFRFEWAFSRQFSVVALRDDNGEFGIDFQYKKQFK